MENLLKNPGSKSVDVEREREKGRPSPPDDDKKSVRHERERDKGRPCPPDEDEQRERTGKTNELLDFYRVADEEINKPWKGKDKLSIKNGSNKRNLKFGVGQKVTGRETKSDNDESDSNSDDSAVAQIYKRAPLHLLF